MPFDPTRFTSLAQLVVEHARYYEKIILAPFLQQLHEKMPSIRADFNRLRESFLGEPLWETPPAPRTPEGFWLESTRKDAANQLRQYNLGKQARGLHVDMRGAKTELEHLSLARSVPHPSSVAQQTLEPQWRFVFSNLEVAFRAFGIRAAAARLVDYRARVRRWFLKLKRYLAPLQDALNKEQPPGPASVSSHVQTLFLYVLLTLTNYSNPLFAFKFFHGAPVVGEFRSTGLTPRVKIQGPFTDEAIRRVGVDCGRHADRTVKPVLSPKAAAMSMKKMEKDFATGTLRGPYKTKEELRLAMQAEIRKNPGFEFFEVKSEWIIVSAQFSVEELEAWEEAQMVVDADGVCRDFKIRNIWNAKKLNQLTQSYATYVPNSHSCVATVVCYWMTLLVAHGFPGYSLLGYPADFSSAYRQMPLSPLQMLFAASAYFHYEGPNFDRGTRNLAFYTALPFGSSVAPGNWGEVVVALAHIMAYVVLAIITHYVDDICGIEMEELVSSSRETFLFLCDISGLALDMKKSLEPSADFIYLGLQMLLPTRLTKHVFALKIPLARRNKLVANLTEILKRETLTSGQASSMRGRLFFYAHWFQASRSHLTELAARQYSKEPDSALTHELVVALEFFLHTVKADPKFLAGIEPFKLLNREVSWLYTDGSLEHEKTQKGIGGVCFPSLQAEPEWYGEFMNPNVPGYNHIAPIEMFAILRALTLFGVHFRGRALWLFCDNTHAVGCLLRRSAHVREEPRAGQKRTVAQCQRRLTPEEHFYKLPKNLRRAMNELARLIWLKITELDIVVWVEYVWTKVNLADAPSRGEMPVVSGRRVGNTSLTAGSFVKCRCKVCEGYE